MPEIIQICSTRLLAKGFVCATVTVLVLLGTLSITGSAVAYDPAQEATPPSEGAQALTPPSEQAPEAIPPAEPAPEATPPTEPAPEATPPSEPVQETSPPVEQKQEAAPPAEAPRESSPPTEQAQEVVAPVEAIKEEAEEVAIPVEAIKEEAKEVAAPVAPIGELVQEVVPPPVEAVKEQLKQAAGVDEAGKEPAKEVVPIAQTNGTTAEGVSMPIGVAGGSEPPEGPSGATAGEVLGATAGSLPTASATATEETSAATLAATGVTTRMSAAQRAGDFACELSGMWGHCTAGWLDAQSSLSASSVVLAGRPTTRIAAPAGGDSEGFTGGSRSVTPPPGPAPTGAFGGSAAGGSGVALSGFFTLAGLLLLAAPRALRRLRLACQPWRTAFFVLIPERPG